jgi:hypothetical protein
MSHVVTIKLALADLPTIAAACQRLGWSLIENQRTYRWFGTSVGDHPLPDGMTEADLGHCSHAIRVPGARYEIGLRQTSTGYLPVYDYWQSGGLPENAGDMLAQSYATARATQQLRRQGYTVREQRQTNGNIRLIATRA